MTLEENISGIIAKKLEDGTIEKVVEEKLTAAIDSAIGDIFRWGDGEKAIKEKLKEVIVPVIERHNFNDYIVKFDTILTSIINQTNLEDNKHILESFKELMIEPTEKVIKLSDIFKKYKEYVKENIETDELDFCEGSACFECYMEFEMDDKYGYSSRIFKDATVKFTCEHDEKEELSYTLKLYKDEDESLWSTYSIGTDINVSSLRNISKFEIFMHNIKRAFCDIEVDTESESEEIYIEEEY